MTRQKKLNTKRQPKSLSRHQNRTKKARWVMRGCGGMMSGTDASTIIKVLNQPAMKTELGRTTPLANDAGVQSVKTAYGTSTDPLYDIIYPSDNSGTKVWSHGTGSEASNSVTAGIPGRHIYITIPTSADTPARLMGIVIRS